jgi:uncharacterized protein
LDAALSEPRLGRLYATARDLFLAHRGLSHDWDHVKRVLINAARFTAEERARRDIVIPAALLHDIGFLTNPKEPKQHHVHGAEGCIAYLGEWNPEDRRVIAGCILKHKGKFPGYTGMEPQSLEEKVLCDADQIDKFGWVGLLQVVKVYAEYGAALFKNFDTLAGLADGLEEASHIELYTEAGRRMAAELAEPSLAEASRRAKAELRLYEEWSGPA